MSQMTPPRRGRPKGTGIDDRPRLREIAAMIERQPQIRPTTAIKLLGENDPSVIRRLRDKFHAMQAELMADVRKAAAEANASTPAPVTFTADQPATVESPKVGPSTFASPTPAHDLSHMADAADKIAAISAAARVAAPPADLVTRLQPLAERAAEIRTETDAGANQSSAETEGPNPYDALVGLTIEATVNAIEQHMKIFEQALRIPTVAMLVRNQMAVNDALLNIACTAIRANRMLATAA
jgi:hypothetical protein